MKLSALVVAQLIMSAASAVDRTNLRIQVVDAFGTAVRSGLRASLYAESGLVAEGTGGTPLVLNNVPYGRYRLETTGSGFRVNSTRIKLSQPGQEVTVGLVLEKVGDPEPQGLTLTGRVARCSHRSPMWVKLIGLFTDEIVQASLGPDCTFRIPDLDGGRYLAVLFDGSTVMGIKEVRVTVDSAPLVFDD
jgi:hypothetical protein